MAAKGMQGFSRSLGYVRSYTGSKDPLTQCLAPVLSRSMATEAALPSSSSPYDWHNLKSISTENAFEPPKVPTTIYKFPTMEPLRLHEYSSKYLHLPIRKDLLHRAVVFEGDATRQGTASSKTRFEVHGSHRKIRPQKGTGMARLGSRQSPMLRGGGKSFGPHPRDFATELPRKMYDLAWRTALSYRYRKGELFICEDGMAIEYPDNLHPEHGKPMYTKEIFQANHWGKDDGRSWVITNEYHEDMFEAIEKLGADGRVKMAAEVDVKDLLTLKRIIIEQSALEQLLREHQSDLTPKVRAVV